MYLAETLRAGQVVRAVVQSSWQEAGTGFSSLTQVANTVKTWEGRRWVWNILEGAFNQRTHRPGRRFRTKLMSQYICFSPNGQFDVRFEELVSKVQNPGGFLRKNVF